MPKNPDVFRDIPFRPPMDKRVRGSLWKLFKRFTKEYCPGIKRLFLICILLEIAAGFIVYATTITAKHMVDNVLIIELSESPKSVMNPEFERAQENKEQSLESLHEYRMKQQIGTKRDIWKIAVIYFIIVFLLNGLGRLAKRLEILSAIRIFANLRMTLHDKILAIDYDSYREQSPGKLMSYIINDVNSMETLYVEGVVRLVVETVIISIGIVIIFYLKWYLAIFIVVLLPLHGWLYIRIKTPQRDSNFQTRHTNSCLWNFSTQRLNGIKTIMAYARESREYMNFFRLGACYLRDAVQVQRYSAIINSNAWFIQAIGAGLVYVVGTVVLFKGGMKVGDLIMYYGVVTFLFTRVILVSTLNAWFAQISVVMARLYDILDIDVDVKDNPDALDLPIPIKGKIEFSHVTFDYKNQDRASVEDINLSIKAGEWLCLMGASGSGKSTLTNLLTRFYEPKSGEIKIDGIPLDKIKLASLRSHIVLVPQEPQIFSGTIADNICYGINHYSPVEVMAAAKSADLHETIMAMPAKYETILGEKGVTLSGGQRQRLSLARALIADPKILILDDCTSALDARTEKQIQQTLNRVMQGRTSIIVSQRVSMAQHCHKTVVLNKGQIIESGTHDELISLDGMYAEFYRLQTES